MVMRINVLGIAVSVLIIIISTCIYLKFIRIVIRNFKKVEKLRILVSKFVFSKTFNFSSFEPFVL